MSKFYTTILEDYPHLAPSFKEHIEMIAYRGCLEDHKIDRNTFDARLAFELFKRGYALSIARQTSFDQPLTIESV